MTGLLALRARATAMGTTVLVWMLEPKLPPSATFFTFILLTGIPKI